MKVRLALIKFLQSLINIKCNNIMIDFDGNPKLIDFGMEENVVNNCKKNLECSKRLTTNFDDVEATQENLKILYLKVMYFII